LDLLKKALALILLAIPAYGGDILVSQFGGLNTQDNPAVIDPSASQDLINVNITPGGKAVFKRDGYGLFQTLPINTSTTSVHGGYHFQDINGNDIQLWGNDSELAASVGDAAFIKIATGTVGATWQCTDSQGSAYCFTSSRDTVVKTDGSVSGTSYTTIPKGTMGAFTPTRLLVSGVLGSENTIYYSAENTFTNFTTGINATDPSSEIIASPGSRITHIAYYLGKWFWWKDQSFGYITGTGQYDITVTIASNIVGTLDNSSTFWNGNIYFRGQDNHIYAYDGSNLVRLTRSITPTVLAANRRKANSWVQSSQADFAAGASSQPFAISTSISPGDVTVSSFSGTDSANADFNAGTLSNVTVASNKVSLTLNNSGNMTNNGFETAGGVATTPAGWTVEGTWQRNTNLSRGGSCGGGTFTPQAGSWLLAGTLSGSGSQQLCFQILRSGSVVGETCETVSSAHCSWTSDSVSASSYVGRRVSFRVKKSDSTLGAQYATNADSFILGGAISYFYSNDLSGNLVVDTITGGTSTITSGQFTSRSFDTGLTVGVLSPSITTLSDSSRPAINIQTSTSSFGAWNTVYFDSSPVIPINVNRYVRYIASLSPGTTDDYLSTLGPATLYVQANKGTYLSAVNNAPNLTTWGLFTATDNNASAAGSIVYACRSATNSFTVQSTTPSWVTQANNSAVSCSTGTYFQLAATFTVTSGLVSPPLLNDFTFNWYEGSATDKAYITYFNDAIWVSVSSGTSSSTNNRIFYYDLLNQAWLIYDIASNGFLVENNILYIGDPSAGKVYRFGNVSTDNGSAINSYWKSKDFTGDNPFITNEFVQSDFAFSVAATTVTYTYTTDTKTATSVSIPLTDSNGASLIRRGFLLPPGKIGGFYNFKVGDSTTNPKWTFLGHKVHFNPLNWRPQSQ
jgi:hypothetical protein